jgi:hypothetical protein
MVVVSSEIRCDSCGASFVHLEVMPLGDTPEGPEFPCPECGVDGVRLVARAEV